MVPVQAGSLRKEILFRFYLSKVKQQIRSIAKDPKIWFLDTRPHRNSPWGKTQQYASTFNLTPLGDLNLIAEPEGRLRFDSIGSLFSALEFAIASKDTHLLYILCRTILEASAFGVWVFDPRVSAEERLLRGLLLRKSALADQIKPNKWWLSDDFPFALDSDEIEEAREFQDAANSMLDDLDNAVAAIVDDMDAKSIPLEGNGRSAPTKTDRIRELLYEDMEFYVGLEVYSNLSGIAHAQVPYMFDTWTVKDQQVSVGILAFLIYPFIAIAALRFCLAKRADCWGVDFDATGFLQLLKTLAGAIELDF